MRWKRRICWTVLVMLGVLLSGCFPTNRVAVNAQGQMVLALEPDGTYNLLPREDQDLYLFDLKDRSLRRLTDTPEIEVFPQWAPNGRQLLYVTWPADAGGEDEEGEEPSRGSTLWVFDPLEARAVPLLERRGALWDPRFSPDGQEIAFRQAVDEETLLLEIVDARSGEGRYTLEGFVLAYRWRPDGSLIVWKAREITRVDKAVRSILTDVLLVHPRREGSRETLLMQFLLPEGWAPWSPYWEWLLWDLSPDGQTLLLTLIDSPIAFPHGEDPPVALYAVELRGERVERVTRLQEKAGYPAFSPDGRRFAFLHADPNFQEGMLLSVWDWSTGTAERVVSDPGNYLYPFWIDGERLGFVEGREGGDRIWVVDLRDGSRIDLTARIRERF